MTIPDPQLEVLLPVHNEGESIEATVREIFDELSNQLRVQFIVCEDGSVDNTKDVLRRMAESIPIHLIMSNERKGYSRAVRDGMLAVQAEYLLCLDSDGQCDPRDFRQFWQQRADFDVLIGRRIRRADNWMRRWLSQLFYYVYQLFFHAPVHDPSCPFVLIRKSLVQKIALELGEMREGFWWEFVARMHRHGYSIRELPVNHRGRSAGKTQVYGLTQLPRIAYRHVVALFRIWSQTRRI